MPIKPSVLRDFTPFKTRVFSAVRRMVQNIAEMTKIRFFRRREFSFHIYYDLIFLILVFKFADNFKYVVVLKSKFGDLKCILQIYRIEMYI